jgi:peptide/nickel transport system permease protein
MLTKLRFRWQIFPAIIIILSFIIVAIFAEQLAPTVGNVEDGVRVVGNPFNQVPSPPSETALLGTTPGQLDVFYALIHGSRDALIFGLITTLLTALIGILVGAISGMSGGWVNQLGMRFSDGILCFPVIAGIAFFQYIIDMTIISTSSEFQLYLMAPLSLNRTQIVEEQASLLININPVMLALIVLCWVPYARTLNILILQTQKMEYVTAARASGANNWRIFFRHILPNTLAPLIVLITKDMGQMVVLQTTFSFVGFRGMSAWAAPLVVSRSWIIGVGGNLLTSWWVYLPITLAIILYAFGWNLLGDELNRWLNPRKD